MVGLHCAMVAFTKNTKRILVYPLSIITKLVSFCLFMGLCYLNWRQTDIPQISCLLSCIYFLSESDIVKNDLHKYFFIILLLSGDIER